ncbi:cytochrome C [Pararhodonellum marinum]|uniref:cytochrome C n=1 Tax=Pararhodonellum marinum TaxID=2755358 RepID=UPI00188F03C5|nr:cytochrome C [Pararhodonellum marinum]
MEKRDLKKLLDSLGLLSLLLLGLMVVVLAFVFTLRFQPDIFVAGIGEEHLIEESGPIIGPIEEGIHVETGLIAGEGLTAVIANCTNCHSAKLVTQNRFTAEGWIRVIRWMQETQDLWDLGTNEELIVAYLAKYYAPEELGRRKQLKVDEWYELE